MKYLLDTMVLSEARKRAPDPGVAAWLEDALRLRFAGRILSVDDATASLWGRTVAEAARQGHSVPVIDGLLVATARRHALTLVTRNVVDVEGLGVTVLNPWEA